ncbi:MAG: pyridoxine 5'-phosphate synthase [Candidatus Omnitrophota bacterium]
MIRLGVNVDHVATLRQARGTVFPDPILAARRCEHAGCNSIIAHLREDRRHIDDHDVQRLRRVITTEFNLEMSVARDIVDIAKRIKPDKATLVPERRKELTTEGGLDLTGSFAKIKNTVAQLEGCGIEVSLFINPDKRSLNLAKDTGARSIELHTGRYADAPENEKVRELKRLEDAAKYARKLEMFVAAGHGLNYDNVKPVVSIREIEEFNIGHSIICRSVFVGIERSVKEMLGLIRK